MAVIGSKPDLEDEMIEGFRDEVRMTLRDYTGYNILLDNVEFEDEDIEMAIERARRRVNAMPPRTHLAWRHIPPAILFLGTARYLMLSESFLQLRNQIQVQTDGMGSAGVDAKHRDYQQKEQSLLREFIKTARNWKNEYNMNRGFGSLGSGYKYTTRFNN